MTLKNRIENELNRLAASSDGGATQRFRLAVDCGCLESDITNVDQLACAFEHLALITDHLSDATMEQLRDVAGKLSDRLSYLLESISPIEIDEEACVVQLRSLPPAKDDDGTSYYELAVRRGAICLCRYHKAPHHQRRVIPANVTREVFARLAEDFEAAIA